MPRIGPSIGAGAARGGRAFTGLAPATEPAQFGTEDWSVADAEDELGGTIVISILTLPDNGGSAITDIEYQIDAGSWVSLGETTTGDYEVDGLTDDVEVDVAIRAVNAVGAGPASATKAVTPTEGTPSANPEVSYVTTEIGSGGGVSTQSLIDAPLGTAFSSRRVIVAWHHGNSQGSSLTAATINGVSATIHYGGNDATVQEEVHFCSAIVPTGDSGDIVMTFSGAPDQGRGTVFIVDDDLLVNAAPTVSIFEQSADTSISNDVETEAGGFIIAVTAHAVSRSGGATIDSADETYTDDFQTNWHSVYHANDVSASAANSLELSWSASSRAAFGMLSWR